MDPSRLLDVMRERRSLRRYRDEAIPPECVDQIMEAATWAPSAHNRQPWRFVIMEEAESKDRLARAMGRRLRSDLEADGLPEDAIAADVGRSYARITGAPLLILVCASMVDMDVYGDAARDGHESAMAMQSVAMAGQNMLLMASSLGLGACWMCAPLFCQDLVRDLLALPADWMPQGMITLGYPSGSRRKTRQAWSDKTLWR